MTPGLILAAHAPEFDLGRVVFIIMVLLGAFFQWIVGWWKKKRAEAELMRQPPPTEDEARARENAWQRQTGAENQAPPPLVPPNPLEELLKTFREIAAPEVPPPPAPVQSAPKPRAVPVIEKPKPLPAPAKAPSTPAAFVQQRPRHPLAINLAAIGGLRHAVVLREILGPPKALQRTDDHLI